MASSSSDPQWTYDVFLSFRGIDIRNNFLSHLCTALEQRGIYAYKDSKRLRKGECMSPALMRAIEESCIAIVVFSKNYATSTWCLEELTKIMECRKQNNLIVLPVFYKVEPREVRGQRNSYKYALAKHEQQFGKYCKKLKKWKTALSDAGCLSGWHLKDGDEAELIQGIIKEISIGLNRTTLHVAKYPVRIDSQVEELKSMLRMDSKDDIRMVGLWGLGGIGKTTLAKAIYNTIFRQFTGSSFLRHVRETSKNADGLVHLQKRLLEEVLADDTTVHNVDEGIKLIQRRLCCKKVLVVLDDVDHLDQLDALARACEWFGKGSRIIVTTRDKCLLTHNIDSIYEVKLLNDEEAYELFSLHCFPKNQNKKVSENVIWRALHYADGLPLALKELGSFLCGRNELVWKSALDKLADSPNQTINQVLKTSFEVLEHNEKEIFLDVACFFKGCEIEYVKNALNSCGFRSPIGVDVLIERALISLNNGALEMHNLVQLMGRDIVNQECPDPSRRSRLWFYDDVVDVLSGEKGTDEIKAIRLALPSPEEITISPDAFTKMKNLRLLMLLNMQFSFLFPICLPSELQWLKCLPCALRWLKWSKCSAPTLEFTLGQNELVELNFSESCIRDFQQFKKLKFIDLSDCESLVFTPDLSYAPDLEMLDLSGCKNLVEVHWSVGFLNKLEVLLLKCCSNLTRFPNILQLKSLRRLSLYGCSKLESFPQIPEQMDCLRILELDETAITELPTSIENIVSLEQIYLRHCMNLTTLPCSVYNLERLKFLSLEGCSNFVKFPRKLDDSTSSCGSSGFRELSWLDLKNCSLSEVEFLDNLSCFTALRKLYLSGNSINSLPSSIYKRECLSIFS